MKNAQVTLVESLIGNSLKPVEYADINPDKQYLVVVDGIDQYLTPQVRKEILEREDLPEQFLYQMSIMVHNDEEGNLINCNTPGMGRHLYKMVGKDVNMTLVNLLMFMQSLFMETDYDKDQMQDLRRMTNEDILEDYDWFAEQARMGELNITAYDLLEVLN
jgi:hypothetical protein